MDFPALDPYPYGCPVGLFATPSEMGGIVRSLAVKLRDVVHVAIHVVRPSRGAPYPVLSLYADEDDAVPRVLLFPAWEIDRRDPKRRLGYERQVTLMKRMHEGGVQGEAIPHTEAPDGGGTVVVALAASPSDVREIARDLADRLGDLLHFSIAERNDVAAIRAAGPGADRKPRVILTPAWRAAGEQDADIVSTTWVISQLDGAVPVDL
jgi:hypothetical protein